MTLPVEWTQLNERVRKRYYELLAEADLAQDVTVIPTIIAREVQAEADRERTDLIAQVVRLNAALASARKDAKILDFMDAWLDDFAFVEVGDLAGRHVRCDWFAGDGGGHQFTQGKTFREATELAMQGTFTTDQRGT